MRRTAVLLFLLLGVGWLAAQRSRRETKPPAAPTPQEAQARLEADQQAIAGLTRRDIVASMSLDTNALLASWTDDGVLLPPGHAPVSGKEALERYYGEISSQGANAEILAYDENWEEVRIVGDYAFQWGKITVRVKPSSAAAETTHAVHAMRILQRQKDGSWKVSRAMWNEAPAVPPPGQ